MPYHRCPACGVITHSVAARSTVGVVPLEKTDAEQSGALRLEDGIAQ